MQWDAIMNAYTSMPAVRQQLVPCAPQLLSSFVRCGIFAYQEKAALQSGHAPSLRMDVARFAKVC